MTRQEVEPFIGKLCDVTWDDPSQGDRIGGLEGVIVKITTYSGDNEEYIETDEGWGVQIKAIRSIRPI